MWKPKALSENEVSDANPFKHGLPEDPTKFIDAVAGILALTQEEIDAKKRILSSSTNGEMRFPDLPDSALDGRLGEICFNQMGEFPLAYAWPALLAAASSLINERTTRTNLYVALVGPVGSGKSQAIEWSQKILGIKEPTLLDIFCGSSEQLARRTADAAGASRLFSPDELSHLFEKMHIENSSFGSFLNKAYYHDRIENVMGKKETAVYNCVLSIVGGIVSEKFDKLFNSSSTGGFYDRFTFGYAPDEVTYNYKPFEENPINISPTRVVVDREIWQLKSEWRKLHKEWDNRVIEHAIRAAVICAAFSGRTALRAEDLGPAYEMVKYQTLIRDTLKPNAGETYEGKITHKILDYLKRYSGNFIGRRELYQYTHAYDYGGSVADRALSILQANGDIEIKKIGKKKCIRLVTEHEHALDAGPGEE